MWEYGLNMIDLVVTHLGHHWGPPRWFDALKSVPVLDFGHIRNAPKLPISPEMIYNLHICNLHSFQLYL